MNNKYINAAYSNLMDTAEKNAEAYTTASPFPSIVFENFFNESFLNQVLEEFPSWDLTSKEPGKFYNKSFYEQKLGGIGEEPFGEKTKEFTHYLNSLPFLRFLQKLTGIKEVLIPDPYFEGGGLHEIKSGGVLKIHIDFNKHQETNLDRRLNVLIYLNKDWQESYGGHFELWNKDMTKCEKRVLPAFNTLAIFSTSDFSYHGHPDTLTCPPDRSRKSLALYYFTNGRPSEEINPELGEHRTLFKQRVGNKVDIAPKDSVLKKTVRKITPPFILKIVRQIK